MTRSTGSAATVERCLPVSGRRVKASTEPRLAARSVAFSIAHIVVLLAPRSSVRGCRAAVGHFPLKDLSPRTARRNFTACEWQTGPRSSRTCWRGRVEQGSESEVPRALVRLPHPALATFTRAIDVRQRSSQQRSRHPRRRRGRSRTCACAGSARRRSTAPARHGSRTRRGSGSRARRTRRGHAPRTS